MFFNNFQFSSKRVRNTVFALSFLTVAVSLPLPSLIPSCQWGEAEQCLGPRARPPLSAGGANKYFVASRRIEPSPFLEMILGKSGEANAAIITAPIVTRPVILGSTPAYVDLRPLNGMNLGQKVLEDNKFGNLNAWYLGIEGEAPRSATIDFRKNLQALWNRKLAKKNVTGATQDYAQSIVDRYASGDKGLTTLPEFVEHVEGQLRLSEQAIDFTAFCQSRKLRDKKTGEVTRALSTSDCQLLQNIARRISGQDVVAYGMTELLPSRRGKGNTKLLEVLLQHAGSEYLNSLPAMSDNLASFGFYQFTSYAVRHDASGRSGASRVSQFVASPYHIPGSVVALRGDQHHRAAFYFAIYNIGDLILFASDQERTNLAQLYPAHMGEIAEFMAVAHHLPSSAITRTRQWLAGKGKKSLRSFLGPSLKIYAEKTRSNRNALQDRLKHT